MPMSFHNVLGRIACEACVDERLYPVVLQVMPAEMRDRCDHPHLNVHDARNICRNGDGHDNDAAKASQESGRAGLRVLPTNQRIRLVNF